MKQVFTLFTAALLPLALGPAAAAPRRGGEAVIISTGTRQVAGYRVVVEPNGALASSFVPRGQRKAIRRTERMIAVNRQKFFGDLANAGPLSALPAGGTGDAPRIVVRYHGRQSPNLRAATTPSGQVLYQDVKQILQVLRLPIPNVP